MNGLKKFIRVLHINYILAKNGLDQVVISLGLFSSLRFAIYFNPWNWFRKQQLPRAVALRKALEELGPIFIKFGQALSTRPDILPIDVAIELSKLQDNVPPFSSELALQIIESTLGQSAYMLFDNFEADALASASIAQVHAAKLKTGEDVVVKILRPNIKKIIIQDLALLHTLARWADRYWSESKRFKPQEIVKEFEQHLIDELNLHREAANASQLRRNFLHSPLLYVPEVYWDYIRDNILVMERIYGIPVTDVANLHHHKINIKKLAERGIEIFFTQVFRDSFFHADMHPGNIFVSSAHPEEPKYICIDFGIIGYLDENDKRYLAENLLAFFNRDYRKVAQLHIESGWVNRDARIGDFESAVRMVCEPIFEKPLKDISFALVVLQLFQVARRFNMVIQPQLVLLQKTLLAVEGLGRQLYPELDLWATAKPFLEKWIREQLGPKTFIKQLRDNLPFFIEQLPNMPRLINDILILNKQQHLLNLDTLNKKRINTRNKWSSGFAAGLLCSLTLFAGSYYLNFLDFKIFALALVAGAGSLFLYKLTK